MSIYSEKKPSSNKPFKTVTVEYFEEFETDDKKVTPAWQGQGKRRIRTITTETKFVGSTYDPIVVTRYDYL